MRIFASLYQYNTYLTSRFANLPRQFSGNFESLQKWIDDDHSNLFQSLFRELCKFPEVSQGEWTIGNSPHLQNAWLKRDSPIWQSEISEEKILLRQLKFYKPDVFLAFHFPKKSTFLSTLKREVPSIRLIVGWDGRKLHNPSRFQGIDLMLSCTPAAVDFYRRHNFEAALLPFHFDRRILECLSLGPKFPRVVFSGGIHIAQDGHNERLRLLSLLQSLPEFEPYLEFNGLDNWRVWAGLLKRKDWDHLISLIKLKSINRAPVYGKKMFQLLSSSLITANVHIDAADNYAGNIRMFEATGVGTCLVTDQKSNLSEFFVPDSEVVSYSSAAECLEKCRWLLDNPKIAEEIAAKGAKRTEVAHSSRQRASELVDLLVTHLKMVG